MPDETKPPRRLRVRLHVTLALVATAIGLGVWWWLESGRHRVFPKNFGVVEEGRLYRSGRIHGDLIGDVLDEHDIALVVDLAGNDVGRPHFEEERVAAQELGIRHVSVDTLDGYGIGPLEDYQRMLTVALRARQEGKPVLVHCAGGSERTGVFMAWFRMLYHGWDGKRAYDEYLAYRHDPPENDLLPRYVNEHLPAVIEHLKAEGLLENAPDPLPVFGPQGRVP